MIFRYWWINQRIKGKKWKNWDCKLGWLHQVFAVECNGHDAELGSNCQANRKWGNFIWIYCWNVALHPKGPSRKCVGHLRQYFDSPFVLNASPNGISNNQPEAKEAPLLKDFQILACDTVNGTYLFFKLEHQGIVYLFPPSLKNWTLARRNYFEMQSQH